jgi:hypothetical protein
MTGRTKLSKRSAMLNLIQYDEKIITQRPKAAKLSRLGGFASSRDLPQKL